MMVSPMFGSGIFSGHGSSAYSAMLIVVVSFMGRSFAELCCVVAPLYHAGMIRPYCRPLPRQSCRHRRHVFGLSRFAPGEVVFFLIGDCHGAT